MSETKIWVPYSKVGDKAHISRPENQDRGGLHIPKPVGDVCPYFKARESI
jgi:hypothetical protein